MAAAPEVISHGNNGMKAPMAKVTNEERRRLQRFARLPGEDAQLLAGVGLEGDVGVPHHLDRQLLGQGGVDATALVDGGQLLALHLGVVADGLAFDVKLPEHQLGLRPHRDVLAGGHREGTGDQTGDAGQAHRPRRARAPRPSPR